MIRVVSDSYGHTDSVIRVVSDSYGHTDSVTCISGHPANKISNLQINSKLCVCVNLHILILHVKHKNTHTHWWLLCKTLTHTQIFKQGLCKSLIPRCNGKTWGLIPEDGVRPKLQSTYANIHMHKTGRTPSPGNISLIRTFSISDSSVRLKRKGVSSQTKSRQTQAKRLQSEKNLCHS